MTLKKILVSKPVLLLEIIVLVYFAFNVGQEIYQRQDIAAEIKRLENEIGKLEKDKNDLGSLLSYVQTDAFVEAEAREKLNLAKDGESLVLLPQADTGATGPVSASPPSPAGAVVRPTSNLVKWWQYFFEHKRLARE